MSDAVLIAIVVGSFSTITGLITLYGVLQTKQVHQLINSRMTEMLDLTKHLSYREGVDSGRVATAERQVSGTPMPVEITNSTPISVKEIGERQEPKNGQNT